jgi:hypothetical protein
LEEFIQFYNTLEGQTNWGMLLFMMLMSMFVAIFHTVIIGNLWNINFKPKWLFFVLNPSLICFFALFDKRIGILIFIILLISVFVFGILGMIIASIREGYKNVKRENLHRKKTGKKPLAIWKKIIITFSTFVFFGFIFSLGLPYFILIIFIILPFISSIFSKNNKKLFYKLQRNLPTANIRSLAMGLAEITGKSKTIVPMRSRLKDKECIGFLYTVENVTRDNEGRYSYSLEFSETVCEPFLVEDKTGTIKVDPKEIEFIDFEIDEQYQSSMKRYTQYLLNENRSIFLVGKASIGANNEPIFQKEEIKNVFGIAPVESINSYNDFRPLIKSAGYFIYFWVILIALILLTPIHLKNNTIEIEKINWKLPFNNSKPINSVYDFYDQVYDSYDKKINPEYNSHEIEESEEAEDVEVAQDSTTIK